MAHFSTCPLINQKTLRAPTTHPPHFLSSSFSLQSEKRSICCSNFHLSRRKLQAQFSINQSKKRRFNYYPFLKSSIRVFMEMKSGRGIQEDEDDDEEEFVSKRGGGGGGGGSSQKDARGTEPKANTPRSKHSATEQRRRSKINDRFQILRDLIPQNDQKRDKASFLLEVIEYIQVLQEKVNKYEGTYQGWNQEPMKLTPWRNGHGHGESMIDHSRTIKNGPGPALIFSGKFEDGNIPVTPSMLANTQNVIESDLSSNAYKPMDQLPVIADKVILPIPMQTNLLNPIVRAGGLAQPPQMSISDAENMIAQPQSQLWQGRPCPTEQPVTGEKLNEQEDMAIEGGTISIAGVYSQELLNNLTQALQSSGVDLSQASISVQVDLGKRAISKLNAMTPSAKDHEDPSTIRAMEHSMAGSSGEDSDQAQKRLKSEK